MAADDGSVLTVEEARRISAPLYDALNRPSEKDVPALLAQACHDDYRSYVTNEEATGTPVAEFWGAAPTGKSFKTMAIDLFTVRDGRLAEAYHVENWMTALEQLKA